MRRLLLATLVPALIMTAGTAARAGVSLVDEQNGRLTFEVTFERQPSTSGRSTLDRVATPGLPPLEYHRVFVAVPDGARVRADIGEGRFEDIAGGLPRRIPPEPGMRGMAPHAPRISGDGFFPTSPAVVSEPFTFRRTTVVAVDCYATQVDYASNRRRAWSHYRLDVTYPPAARPVTAAAADPLLLNLVENGRYLPRKNGGRAAATVTGLDAHFSNSANWVRIRITETGVYSITGNDLAALGVNLSAIVDPASFRLFTGTGREVVRDLRSGGSWQNGNWMEECDIAVEYGGDGTFDPADRIIFYATALEEYADLVTAGAPREGFLDYRYAKDNVYFLTWDGSFGGPPGRMAGVGVAPTVGPDVTTFEERLYFEEDRVEDLDIGGDGWLWLDVSASTGPETRTLPQFFVRDLDASQPQTFRTVAVAGYSFAPGAQNSQHHAIYEMNGAVIGDISWDGFVSDRFRDGTPVSITGGSILKPGWNVFKLTVPRDNNPKDFMLFAWYEVRYHRRLAAFNDALAFSSPDTTGAVTYRVTGFGTAGSLYLLDVTDRNHPGRLTGFGETISGGTREVRFSAVSAGARRYFWAGTASAMKSPASMIRYFPRDLRNVTSAPHMLIVTPPGFRVAADRLRQYRLGKLPFFSSPRVEVASTDEVFDNFSGGVVDPAAIRNYCKFLYDNFGEPDGSPSLTFLLLLGDANVDFKNITTSEPNWVTTNVNMEQLVLEAYVTDDWFALMDSTDVSGSRFIDFAVGRLPAATSSEARLLVNKVIDYETLASLGEWRDRVVLVADDEVSSQSNRQAEFVIQSEVIANAKLAWYLDPVKIYLTEFPAISGIKPASRLFLLNTWDAGALVVNYVGHGSSRQMADELVFLDTDVPNLRNGLKLPLVMAFSCTLGKFGNARSKSLAEKLLIKDGGGAIAAIAASELTFTTANRVINFNIFEEMFPPEPGLATPLGVALLQAKARSLNATPGSRLVEENNEKYNLLGDPAMRLLSPAREIRFAAGAVDSLVTGRRQAVHGEVLDNGALDRSFSGTVELIVREPDDPSGYLRESDGFSIPYNYPGGTLYRGSADVNAGEFDFDFKVPRSADVGPRGFMLAYADNGVTDAVANFDSIVYVRPLPGDSTALFPVDGPPRVDLGFQSGSTKLKPGAVVQARIHDADGINILSTTPEGKLALVFDRSNLPLDVTEFFEFDHGGADTSGVLRFPLPDLSVGVHRAVLKVSDTFGQTRLDTVNFTVTDPLDFSAEVVLNYPNPFSATTYFLVELTDRARVRIELFTLSGRRVRTIEETKDPGQAWIFWDGMDATGDDIANGTYLYVARVSFVGLDRPSLVLRGKVVKIE